MWKCEYCGHQQDLDARKCMDCNAPRGDVSREIVTFSRADTHWIDEYYHNERIKAQNALNETINDARITIGEALFPVLELVKL